MDSKYLRNVIKELSKVVPSSYLVTSGFLLDIFNSPYNVTWSQYDKPTGGMGQIYVVQNTNTKIDKAEETLGKMCQGLLNQGNDALYKFIVFLIKSYCRNYEEKKVEINGLKIALRSIGISDFYEMEKYAKDTPLIESIINIGNRPEISNVVDRIQESCSVADSEIDFQNIGNSCRNLIINLAQLVYNPTVHGEKNNEGKTISKTDAKGMLTNYFNHTLSGSSNDEYRKYGKAVNDLVNMLTHKRNATKRDMLLTVSSTIAFVRFVMILENDC